MLTVVEKLAIFKEFGKNEQDSGASAVQVALLSKRIIYLQGHLQTNKKDYSSLRGLMKLVNTRKKLLTYLHKTDEASYKDVIKRLGLRK
jgi:small subunit ribosomal protein S15